MKLLLDEHYRPGIAGELRRRGHDVVAVLERSDLLEASDASLLRIAHAEGRALVTEDAKHFAPLTRYVLFGEHEHSGVVLVSARRFPRRKGATGSIVAALDALLAQHPGAGELVNRTAWLKPAP